MFGVGPGSCLWPVDMSLPGLRTATSDDEQVTSSAVEWDRPGPLPSFLSATRRLLTRNSVVVAAGSWRWGLGGASDPLALGVRLGISALIGRRDLEPQDPPMLASIPAGQVLLLQG